MHRPSLPGARAHAAAIVVAAASALALLAAAPSAVAGIVAPPGGIVAPPPVVIKPPSPPAFPGLYALQAAPLAVTVAWYDRSSDEQKFVLYRRDLTGAWQELYEVSTRNVAGGGDYSYVDTDRSISGQCYMLAAVNQNGAGYSKEECTVRPDPSRFPQSVPQAVRQWAGLSSVNDGTGDLQNTTRSSYTSLTWSSEYFGVNLGWSENGALWKIEAQGGPQLMKGQAVALRVWGGGWLEYGNETFGVDLVLSDKPAYEWYVVGGPPGTSIDGTTWALWNSSANDYLVSGGQDFGVSLNWYKKTVGGGSGGGGGGTAGVKTFVAYNCISEQRPLEMWVADLSAGTGYVDMGGLASQWTDGGCPTTGTPWTFTPASGHEYVVTSVDYLAFGCSNDPTIGDCWRSQTTFVGDANGQVVSTTIG